MLELEEALQRILSAIHPLDSEALSIHDAAGRVLTDPIKAAIDLPPFDNSAMDGYAVRAADVAGASADHPVSLRLTGRIAAGEVFTGAVEAGSCVRLFTGSPLPRGADGVVMQEDTRPDPEQADVIRFLDAIKPWENVRFQGEDTKSGATLLEAGSRLNAVHLGLLAAAGINRVRVARRPRVALVATGSELTESGRPLSPGKIYESNRLMLVPLLEQAGAVPRILPLVPDTFEATRATLKSAFAECDAVVTSGGASVGDYDFVKTAFEKLGGELAFWKVAIRPGKPFVFGRVGNKFLFGLPGNPVSALVTFLFLARPALTAMQGAAESRPPASTGVLTESLANPGDRRHFMRVTTDDAGQVRSAGVQSSHIVTSLAKANGLVEVPPRTTLPVGSSVSVYRWNL